MDLEYISEHTMTADEGGVIWRKKYKADSLTPGRIHWQKIFSYFSDLIFNYLLPSSQILNKK